MAENLEHSQTGNFQSRIANKLTLEEERQFSSFKNILKKACVFRCQNPDNDTDALGLRTKLFKSYLNTIDKFLAAHEKIMAEKLRKPAVLFEVQRGLELMAELRQGVLSELESIETGKKDVGRPTLHGELAMILYAALENAKGNRNLKNQIGEFIKAGGELMQFIDGQFGGGQFASLLLPAVSDHEERWERGAKGGLEANAKKHFNSPSMTVLRYINTNPTEHKDPEAHFAEALKNGGVSGYEDWVKDL